MDLHICSYMYVCMYVCMCMYGNRERRFPWKLRSGQEWSLCELHSAVAAIPSLRPNFGCGSAPPPFLVFLSLSLVLSRSPSLCGSLSLMLIWGLGVFVVQISICCICCADFHLVSSTSIWCLCYADFHLVSSTSIWCLSCADFHLVSFHETVDGVFQNYCFNPSVIVCFQ